MRLLAPRPVTAAAGVPKQCASPDAPVCVPDGWFVKRMCNGSFPDVAYGHGAERTLAWVEECLDRLDAHTRDVTVTDLPLASLRRLTPLSQFPARQVQPVVGAQLMPFLGLGSAHEEVPGSSELLLLVGVDGLLQKGCGPDPVRV